MAYAQRMGFAQNFNSETEPAPGSTGAGQQEDWNALRDELETLLAQVNERQQDKRFSEERIAPSLASARKNPALFPTGAHQPGAHQPGSHQPGAHPPKSPRTAQPAEFDRREQALLSVQRAVERFNEPYEAAPMPAHPQNQLQSAIEQIRASQARAGTRKPASNRPTPVAANKDQIEQMDRALGEINQRFARLEEGIGASQGSGQALQEMATQIEQLSSVVELLANSVGERGQIKQLETQISRLAGAVSSGPDLDFSSINQRLDVLSGAFEHLTQLQTRQLEHASNGPDVSQVEAIEQGVRGLYDRIDTLDLSAIESSVRALYSRLDSLEKSMNGQSPALEKLSAELADFSKAMQSAEGSPLSPATIGEHMDALNQRIAVIENEGAPVGGLKVDMGELSAAVVSALEPRFSALESQIGFGSSAVSETGGDLSDLSVEQLEEQIRALSAKMDQTSAELNGLQKFYDNESAGGQSPDFRAIADLVAQRAGEAVREAQTNIVEPVDQEALDALENRLSNLFEASGPRGGDELSGVQNSIEQVNQRLARLEKTLSEGGKAQLSSAMQEPSTFVSEPAFLDVETVPDEPGAYAPPEPGSQRRPLHPGLGESFGTQDFSNPADELAQTDTPLDSAPPHGDSGAPVGNHLLAALGDTMPRSPTAETELNAPAFPPPDALDAEVPVPSALQAEAEDLMVLEDLLAEEEGREGNNSRTGRIKLPQFNSQNTAPPPAPTSSFAVESAAASAEQAPGFAQHADDGAGSGAIGSEPGAQQVRPNAYNEDEGGKVSRSTFIEAARRAAKSNNTEKPETGSQSLIAKALARFQKKQTSETDSNPDQKPVAPKVGARELASKAERAPLPRNRDDVSPNNAPMADSMDVVEVEESFLSRHRQPILLVATLAAVSMLALNLINQRFTPATAGANGAGVEQAGIMEITPPVSPDQNAPANGGNSSSNPSEPGPNDIVGSIEPTPGSGNAGVRLIDPALISQMPASLDLASISASQITAAPSASALPPESLGPLELREAAANGDPRAQFEVAAIFAEGRTIAQDLSAAAIWYERSAAQGFAPASYRLGNMYENGVGVDKDLELARIWYRRAADMGNRMSMHNLASLLASGGLGEQKFAEAAVWFEQAAALGLRDSQFNLGMLHARGLGVPQDLEASFKWFSIAAAGGDEDAARARDDVLRSLDPQTVTRLQAEIEGWHQQDMNLLSNFAPLGTWSENFDPGPTIDDRDIVMRVQAALNKLGFDTGTPDGIAGSKTGQAISAFERATGMSESGKINPRLLSVLGSQPV